MRRALLDTSVVIDWHDPEVAQRLPDELAVSSITLAELAAAPHLARDPLEAARRQVRLQEVEARFEPLPVDAAVAASYGIVVAATAGTGRAPRRRIADLLIAATSHAHALPLLTRNAGDLGGLEDVIDVVGI